MIAYTARATIDDVPEAGLFSAVLLKPADPAVVVATVRQCMEA